MISKYTRSDFLEALFGVYYQEYRGFILVNRMRRGDERTSARYYPKVDILAKEHFGPEQNIYFSVCPRERMKPEKKHIRFATALWAKVYVGEEGNKGRPYFATPQEAAKTIRRFPKPPTIIVESGTGAHLYWVFDQPLEVGDPQRFEKALAHVGGLLKGETKLSIDSMLRLPETINSMIEERFLQCEVKFINANFRYKIEDLEAIGPKEMEESLAAPTKTPTMAPTPPEPLETQKPAPPEEAPDAVRNGAQTQDTKDYLANFNLEAPTEVAESDLQSAAPRGPANVETVWFDSSEAEPLGNEGDDETSERLIDEEIDSDEAEPELDFDAAPPQRPAASWAPQEEEEIRAFVSAPDTASSDADEEAPLLDDQMVAGDETPSAAQMAGPSLTEGIDLDDSMIDELIDDISMSGVYEPGPQPELTEPEDEVAPEPPLEPSPQEKAHTRKPVDIPKETPPAPKERPARAVTGHSPSARAPHHTSHRSPQAPTAPSSPVAPSLAALARSNAGVKVEFINDREPLEGRLVSMDERALCIDSGSELNYAPWSSVALINSGKDVVAGDQVMEAIGIKRMDQMRQLIPAGVRLPASGAETLPGSGMGLIEVYEGLDRIGVISTPRREGEPNGNSSIAINIEHLGDIANVLVEEKGGWSRRFGLPLAAKDHVTLQLTAPPKVARSEAFFVNCSVDFPKADKSKRTREHVDDKGALLRLRLSRGAKVDLELRMRDMEIVEDLRGQSWKGSEMVLRFPVRAPSSLSPGKVKGAVIVSVDSFPIAKVDYGVRVVDSDSRLNTPAIPTGEALRLAAIYPCCAPDDREKARRMLERLRMVGVEFDENVLDHDPQYRWDNDIYKSMLKTDAIILFWSSNARDDQWLIKEMAYAVDMKGNDSIIPVILDQESLNEIPSELADLHFKEESPYLR